jgi:hypothetical protein
MANEDRVGLSRSPAITHLLTLIDPTTGVFPQTPRTTAVGIILEQMLDGDPAVQAEATRALLDLPSPCDHEDHARYAIERYVTEFLKKVPWLPMPDQRRANALKTFRDAEDHCRSTNERLRRDPEPSWFGDVRRTISYVLGPLDHARLSSIEENFKHGPGASVGVRGEGSVGSDKYRQPVTCTAELLPFARAVMGPTWARDQSKVEVVRGGEWTCVTKNADTDRGIVKGPTLNVFGQLGIGQEMVSLLRKIGVDLRTQDWNRALAEMAWEWNLATLDLKAASEYCAYETVRSLFPPDWFTLLALFREAYVKVGHTWVRQEKFSAMGNGYTFPLETLLFAAVVRSVVPRKDRCVTAVYGDDIIVPQKYASEVINRLEYLGFRVNTTKSCLAGNFFESCGSDFLRGVACRPFFAPTDVTVPIPLAVRIANGYRLWLRRVFGYCPTEFRPPWQKLVELSPSVWKRTHVPPEWGDVGIIRSAPLKPWSVKDKDAEGYGWEGGLARAVLFLPREKLLRDHRDVYVVLAGLRQIGSGVDETSYGREVRKGLYGRPISAYRFAPSWGVGLDWVG